MVEGSDPTLPEVLEIFSIWIVKQCNKLYQLLDQDLLAGSAIGYIAEVERVLQFINKDWLMETIKLGEGEILEALMDQSNFALLSMAQAKEII